jgi:hypothetical protein
MLEQESSICGLFAQSVALSIPYISWTQAQVLSRQLFAHNMPHGQERLGVLVFNNSVDFGAIVLFETEADRVVWVQVVAVFRDGVFVDEGELEGGNAISVC